MTSEEEEEKFICQVWKEHSLNLHEFDISLSDERVQRSEGIQNWSCQQIWGRHYGYVCRVVLKTEDNRFLVRTLVFAMFPRFLNTQTCLNKQTMSWCKDFLWRHVFLIVFFLVKLTERCQDATPHLFCVKDVTRQQGTQQQEQRHLFLLVCVR